MVTADTSAKKPDAICELDDQPYGLAGNVTVASKKYILGVREYGPPAKDDGHFGAAVKSANDDLVRLVSSSVSRAYRCRLANESRNSAHSTCRQG